MEAPMKDMDPYMQTGHSRSEMKPLLRQFSYAMKTQPRHPRPRTRSISCLSLCLYAMHRRPLEVSTLPQDLHLSTPRPACRGCGSLSVPGLADQQSGGRSGTAQHTQILQADSDPPQLTNSHVIQTQLTAPVIPELCLYGMKISGVNL